MRPIQIRVLAFAGARDIIGVSESVVVLAGPIRAEALMAELCTRHPGLVPYAKSLRLAVNGLYAMADDPVVDGDEVALIPPVAGG